MKKLKVTVAVEGALALMMFVMMLGVAARGLRLDSEPVTAAVQEPQAPTTTPDQAVPDEKAGKAVVYTGTIVKDGSDFVLRDESGTVYRLDAPSKARPYEGKSVEVAGRVQKDAKLIHVEQIRAIGGGKS